MIQSAARAYLFCTGIMKTEQHICHREIEMGAKGSSGSSNQLKEDEVLVASISSSTDLMILSILVWFVNFIISFLNVFFLVHQERFLECILF